VIEFAIDDLPRMQFSSACVPKEGRHGKTQPQIVMKKSLLTPRLKNSARAPQTVPHNAPATARLAPIERQIYLIRGQKVMLDRDLALLYGVETRALNQAVRRNTERFPCDFMFSLNAQETQRMRSQIVIASPGNGSSTSTLRKRNLRYRPLVFTEQGIAMLSSVLRSSRAILVNVEIMRAFVRLRQLLASHAELAHKLAALEKKYDRKFKIVFDAIRQLMTEPKSEPAPSRREIGFHAIAAKPENRPRLRSRIPG